VQLVGRFNRWFGRPTDSPDSSEWVASDGKQFCFRQPTGFSPALEDPSGQRCPSQGACLSLFALSARTSSGTPIGRGGGGDYQPAPPVNLPATSPAIHSAARRLRLEALQITSLVFLRPRHPRRVHVRQVRKIGSNREQLEQAVWCPVREIASLRGTLVQCPLVCTSLAAPSQADLELAGSCHSPSPQPTPCTVGGQRATVSRPRSAPAPCHCNDLFAGPSHLHYDMISSR
jgi:hypothetical protein